MEHKRVSWPVTIMKQALIVADRSTCLKKKVGAIIAKKNKNNYEIISQGYNGTFSKEQECCDYWYDQWRKAGSIGTFKKYQQTQEFKEAHRQWSLKNEIHAEVNAIAGVTRSNNSSVGTVLFTIYSPCDSCVKHIIAAKISEIYYKILYKDCTGNIEKLNSMGIKCIHIDW